MDSVAMVLGFSAPIIPPAAAQGKAVEAERDRDEPTFRIEF